MKFYLLKFYRGDTYVTAQVPITTEDMTDSEIMTEYKDQLDIPSQ